MKRALISMAILLASAAAAQAQVVITYTNENKNSKLTFTYSSGYYSGYGGYGYGGYGGGYGGGYSPGFIYNSGGRTFTFGTNFLGDNWWGYPAGYGRYGTTYYGNGGYGYGGSSYGARYRVPTYIDYQRPVGASREVGQMNVEKTGDAGLMKFKAGDYAGALAAFRKLVVHDFSSAGSKLWMALALAGTGDYKNAEKALRSASATNDQLNSVDLKAMMKDAKEQARFAAAVEKAGGVVAGFVLERLGEKEKAKAALDAVLKAAPKDTEAAKLRARLN